MAALIALVAVVAFRLGTATANLTEGDVILAYADRYTELAGPRARPADCLAVPGQGARVWITVLCGPPGAAAWRFDVNRMGGLVRMVPPGGAAAGADPQT